MRSDPGAAMQLPAIRFSRPEHWLAFAPEWLALALVAMIDVLWARHIGFHLILTVSDFHVLAGALVAMLAARVMGYERFAVMAEFLAITLSMAMGFIVLSYLSMASSGALVDRQLEALDRAMGFDWLAGFKFLLAHPLAAKALDLLYGSENIQALYICVLMGLMSRKDRLHELFWIVFIATAITNAGAVLFPALGPFKTFGLESHGGFLPDMQHLMSRHNLTFALSKMTGVICFPSFHTVMALVYVYAYRKLGALGYILAAINLLMLIGIPYIGGHYLTDMIAGAGVFFVSLGIVRLAYRVLPGLVPAPVAVMIPAHAGHQSPA